VDRRPDQPVRVRRRPATFPWRAGRRGHGRPDPPAVGPQADRLAVHQLGRGRPQGGGARVRAGRRPLLPAEARPAVAGPGPGRRPDGRARDVVGLVPVGHAGRQPPGLPGHPGAEPRRRRARDPALHRGDRVGPRVRRGVQPAGARQVPARAVRRLYRRLPPGRGADAVPLRRARRPRPLPRPRGPPEPRPQVLREGAGPEPPARGRPPDGAGAAAAALPRRGRRLRGRAGL
ncbi:MAG: hypothetical protein AVDCRST_MAG64-837, partial [uncultured Phycisphaerae bacterium]